MQLSEQDQQSIEAQVTAFEQATGAQAVVSVVDRCDSYPEVPWRAFALGAAIASLCAGLLLLSGLMLPYSVALMFAIVMCSGVGLSLLTLGLPTTGRWLLPVQRREAELRQYAQALFLTRELFATSGRKAILILLGLYERRAVVLVDRGLREQLTAGQVEAVESQLSTALGRGQPAQGVQAALAALQGRLQDGAGAQGLNEIPDALIRERGH